MFIKQSALFTGTSMDFVKKFMDICEYVYSASAECLEPTKLLKTGSDELSRILEADAENGMIFFKQLAASLGNRLLKTYKVINQKSDE
ncbi:MAG: hypothetical protein P8185_07800 [Deltaproteobacteria bacterium]